MHLLVLGALAAAGCTGAIHARGSVLPGATVVPPQPATPVETAAAVSMSVEVEISFFGIPLAGADDVVFVLDRSGSMGLVSTGVAGRDLGMSQTESVLTSLGGTLVNGAAGGPLPSKLEAAKGELIRTLRAMPDGTRFGIIFFDDEIAAVAPELWVLGPNTRYQAEAFIRGIEPSGSTAAVPAMRLAYQMGARRVILLSDGLANTGGSGGDLLQDARAQMQRGLRIDTVGVGLDQDDQLLRTLAAESGGIAVSR